MYVDSVGAGLLMGIRAMKCGGRPKGNGNSVYTFRTCSTTTSVTTTTDAISIFELRYACVSHV